MAKFKCKIVAFGHENEREVYLTDDDVKERMKTVTDALGMIGFQYIGGEQVRSPMYLVSFTRVFEEPTSGVKITLHADFS